MSEQPYESTGPVPVCAAPRRPWLIGVSLSTKRAVAFKPRCKSWNCPACAEINSRLWAVRAYHGVEAHTAAERTIYFLTLTSHESLDPAGTIKVFPQAWKTLRQRANRQAGYFSYLMIPERHKDGRMHAHLLESGGAGERWWKDNARACGFGYMVDEQAVENPAAASFYVVKYIGKGLASGPDWPKNFRRVRVSKNWPAMPEMEEVQGWSWRLVDPDYSLVEEIERIKDSGFEMQVLDHATAWTYARADWSTGEVG